MFALESLRKMPLPLREQILDNLASNSQYYGDIFNIQSWNIDSYNDKKFLNAYLFGEFSDVVDATDSRSIRDQINPETTSRESAITVVFNEDATSEFMADGPGKYATFSAVPIVQRFFSSAADSLAPGEYSIERLEQDLYLQSDRILNRSWANGKVPNFFALSYYDTDTGNSRLSDPDFMNFGETFQCTLR